MYFSMLLSSCSADVFHFFLRFSFVYDLRIVLPSSRRLYTYICFSLLTLECEFMFCFSFRFTLGILCIADTPMAMWSRMGMNARSKRTHTYSRMQVLLYTRTHPTSYGHLVFVRCFFPLEILPRATAQAWKKTMNKTFQPKRTRKIQWALCYESVGVCSLIAEDVQKLVSSFEQIN